jgi:hypothetical protein
VNVVTGAPKSSVRVPSASASLRCERGGGLGEGDANRSDRLPGRGPGPRQEGADAELKAQLLASAAGLDMPVGVDDLPFGLGLDPPPLVGGQQVQEPHRGLQAVSDRGCRGEQVVKRVQLPRLVMVGNGHRDVRVIQGMLG